MDNPSHDNPTAVVVGATGATGRLLVRHLLERGVKVKTVVRSLERVPEDIRSHPNFDAREGELLSLSDDELDSLVSGCSALASCLGHNLSFRGMFGPPYRLVTDATRRLCEAAQRGAKDGDGKVRFVLMNTTGNRNRDLNEEISFAQKCVIGLLRLLLPPHADNESAADYLRRSFGQDHAVLGWAAVRPDNLVNDEEVSEYELHESPIRSAIFDAGKTSRINVAHFMAELMTNRVVWSEWNGRMPVIYNKETPDSATES